jgi:hypothetical protein
MTLSVSHHEPGLRPGADACPGIDERGHGLTMTLIHDGTCCAEWESGSTPSPGRAAKWFATAARWGTTWPRPSAVPQPEAGANR